MNVKQGFIRQIGLGFLVACAVYIATQTILYFPVLTLQNLLDDSHFTRRYRVTQTGGQNHGGVVIVDVDDRTIRELGDFNSFNIRRNLGEVIDNIKNDGARLIFLDVIFRRGGNLRENRFLVDSIRMAGNVFSGFYLSLDTASLWKRPSDTVLNERLFRDWFHKTSPDNGDLLQSHTVDFSFHELNMSAERLGFTNCIPDRDGILRHIPLIIRHKKVLLTSAALQMWLYLRGYDAVDAEMTPHGIRVDGAVIPVDRHAYLRINYRYSQDKAFSYVSYADVLYRAFEPGMFYGKIVLLGSSSPALKDIKKIPGNMDIPGVEVHASALMTMLNNDYVKTVAGTMTFVFTIASGVFTALAFLFLRTLWGRVLFSLAVPLVLYMVAIVSFIFFSLLVNVVTPALTVLVYFAVCDFSLYPSNGSSTGSSSQ